MVGSYLIILRRSLAWIVALAVVLGVTVFLYLTSQAPVYRSEAVIEVTFGTAAEQLLGQQRSYEEPQRRVTTEAELVTSPPVAELAAERLRAEGRRIDPLEASGRVEATARRSSNYVVVAGTDATRRGAQSITQAFAQAYVDYRQGLRDDELAALEQDLVRARDEAGQELAASPQASRAAIQGRIDGINDLLDASALRQALDTSNQALLSSASLPQEPDNKIGTGSAVALSAFAGLLLALALILGQELLHDTVRTRKEAADLTPLPALGMLRGARGPADISPAGATGAEGDRGIRLGLLSHFEGRLPGSVVLASLPADSGSCLLAARSLALNCAAAGQSVILVADADDDEMEPFTRPDHFAPGLVRPPASLPGVHEAAATSGPAVQGLLDLATPGDTLRELSQAFDIVIIAAPGTHDADPADVGALADATIPVCAMGRTSAKRFRRMVDGLGRAGLVLPGIILVSEAGKGRRKPGIRTARSSVEDRAPEARTGRGSTRLSLDETGLRR